MDRKPYISSFRSVFNGIGHTVKQDLAQSYLIYKYIFMYQVLNTYMKHLPLCSNRSFGNAFDGSKYILDTYSALVKIHLAAFNGCHIQNIVKKGKKLLGRLLYLPKIILLLLIVFYVGQGKIGVSDDGIHRSTKVMGHIGKEGSLGLGGLFCLGQCCLKFFLLCPFLLHQVSHLTDCNDDERLSFLLTSTEDELDVSLPLSIEELLYKLLAGIPVFPYFVQMTVEKHHEIPFLASIFPGKEGYER